jgi:hypothetical protein
MGIGMILWGELDLLQYVRHLRIDCYQDCRAACGGEEAALEARAEQHATGRKGRESLSGPFSR